jgi:hypothetical protein
VTRGHSDHEKLLLSDETVRVHKKCQRSYTDEKTAAVAAKRKASSEQRYLHVRNNLINEYVYIYKNGIVEKLKD